MNAENADKIGLSPQLRLHKPEHWMADMTGVELLARAREQSPLTIGIETDPCSQDSDGNELFVYGTDPIYVRLPLALR